MTTDATQVKERPILFSGPMVRATLVGRKTQTRRVLKKQPPAGFDLSLLNGRGDWQCPYGKPGERLWVRETFHVFQQNRCRYRADYLNCDPFNAQECGDDESLVGEKWKPAIFMPRWASRVMLEIVGVRVERVQEISPADVAAEGFQKRGKLWTAAVHASTNPVDAYALLWDVLNEDRGFGWEKNPWVWVIEFKRVRDMQTRKGTNEP